MKVKRIIVLISITLAMLIGFKGFASASHEDVAKNNLSFPVIAVDGFEIISLPNSTFTSPYIYDNQTAFEGLTESEISSLLGEPLVEGDPGYEIGCTYGSSKYRCWYPQQTEGNEWQAGFKVLEEEVAVSYIDWGDNIEAVNPKKGRPFRLEIVLYKQLDTAMTAYEMTVLENPSSPDELQGTNTITYLSDLASVTSTLPRLVVQYLHPDVSSLSWSDTYWETKDADGHIIDPEVIDVGFAPELNVGGKYIFGASQGGWKPDKTGTYRITFYIPTGSNIDLTAAAIYNLPSEDPITDAIVDTINNLTYVDVEVVGGGGNRK